MNLTDAMIEAMVDGDWDTVRHQSGKLEDLMEWVDYMTAKHLQQAASGWKYLDGRGLIVKTAPLTGWETYFLLTVAPTKGKADVG